MQTVYRIYTEEMNVRAIKDILNLRFDGYTLFYGIGVWKGKQENNLTIEIITDKIISVYESARQIKKLNNQEAVLVTVAKIEGNLV